MLARLGGAAILAGLLAASCLAAEPPGEASGTVTVLAAASLTEAFRAAGEEFQSRNRGVVVRLSFAGSSTLVHQIEQGAPADVFASADEASMRRLADAGLLDGPPSIFARNRLAIAVPSGNPKHVAGLADLARPGLVVALCAPAVPAGRYTIEAFARAGVHVPEASQEADVKAVVTKVALGEADAGVVYATDVGAAGERVEGIEIPESQNVIARYPIAVVKSAPNPAGGRAFVDLIVSESGQRILARRGFLGR